MEVDEGLQLTEAQLRRLTTKMSDDIRKNFNYPLVVVRDPRSVKPLSHASV
jgi:hypothetical protein